MLGILDYLWRLVPANPILQRVVALGGRRRRDMIIRCAYLGLLIVVVLFLLLESAGSLDRADLAQLTKRSGSIFWTMSYVQLGLVALLAPIFTAGAITQEKDSQTYDILLSTPLTNGQIVLGSLLSRLFFVVALLVSGIPIFSITQVFGGVAIQSIIHSFAIAAATAFVTGAMAMAIAVFKVGTRRTIFSFYLFTVLFMAIPLVIEYLGYLRVPGSKPGSHINWLTGINPFLALRVIFNDQRYVPPEAGTVAGYAWPLGWYLSSPHTFYVSFMFFLSFVLVMPSIVVLRRLAQSTMTIRHWLLQKLRLSSGDRRRRIRRVWSNPVAWREARTKASAARAFILRYAFMAAGTAAAVVLLWLYNARVEDPVTLGASGYNPITGTVTIIENGQPRTVRVERRALIRVGDQPGDFSSLRPRRPVKSYTLDRPGGSVLAAITLGDPQSRLGADRTRQFLMGTLLVEFAVILLILTQSAASTVTREKEDGTLDLLLSTPITSRYYIWGKLRGLVSFVLPLLAVPMFSVLLFVAYDMLRWFGGRRDAAWLVYPESLLVMPGTLVMVSAFAAILGMQMSLRCRTTVMAVMSSVGIVGGVCFGLAVCGSAALSSRDFGQMGVVLGSLSPFTLITMMVNPDMSSYSFSQSAEDSRMLMFFFGWVATAGYAMIVWAMYKSMVRNFDMTIRKQAT